MPFAIQRIILCGFLILTPAPALLYADDWYTHEHITLSLKQVEDKDPVVRRFAAEYLGNYGRQCLCTEDEQEAIVKALKKRLHDPDKYARYGAAEALARTNVSPGKSYLPFAVRAITGIGRGRIERNGQDHKKEQRVSFRQGTHESYDTKIRGRCAQALVFRG